MASNLLTSNGARQILGAATGMIVATVLYVVVNKLPSMQIGKALLVDTPSNISNSSSEAASSSVASTASSMPSAAQDHADRTAWLRMREAQRERYAAYDVSSAHGAISASTEMTMNTMEDAQAAPLAFPTAHDISPIQTALKTALPDSGMGLNLIVLVAFLIALRTMSSERRRVRMGRYGR